MSADIALVMDAEGKIQDYSVSNPALLDENIEDWVDRSWFDTVTVESRIKLEQMLDQASTDAAPRWRQVNHPSVSGRDLPVKYTTVPLGDSGMVLAIGREMKAIADLQQRVVETQLAMEREYARHRNEEMRYRLFFQTSREAAIVIDSANNKVVDANPIATELFAPSGSRLTGTTFPRGFDTQGQEALSRLLASTRETGSGEPVVVKREDDDQEYAASAALFRQVDGALFMVTLTPVVSGSSPAISERDVNLLRAAESAPDGVVITDSDGRIVAANESFLLMAQLVSEERAQGETLDRWLGRSAVDLNILMSNLREHRVVRQFGSILQTEFESTMEVEISAALIGSESPHNIGFLIRPLETRTASLASPGDGMFRPAEEFAELVGRVPLKELVQESTDIIERLCIEAALDMSKNNRAAAAEMLGLSRQSLYIKMRRHDLGNLESSDA